MHNSLYPGFTKIYYTVGTKEHVQILPCKPFVDIGGNWAVEFKGDVVGGSWSGALTSWLTVFKALFSNTFTATYAELWTMSSPEADPIYQVTSTLGIIGTNASGSVAMSQVCISGRTQLGGVAKIYALEGGMAVNTKVKPTYAAPYLAIVTYLLGATSWIVGRNGGFWVAAPQITTKTNDTLRRQAGLE